MLPAAFLASFWGCVDGFLALFSPGTSQALGGVCRSECRVPSRWCRWVSAYSWIATRYGGLTLLGPNLFYKPSGLPKVWVVGEVLLINHVLDPSGTTVSNRLTETF